MGRVEEATLKMKAVHSSEMSVIFYQTKEHHIPEDNSWFI
jgi:hypothetical protein